MTYDAALRREGRGDSYVQNSSKSFARAHLTLTYDCSDWKKHLLVEEHRVAYARLPRRRFLDGRRGTALSRNDTTGGSL